MPTFRFDAGEASAVAEAVGNHRLANMPDAQLYELERTHRQIRNDARDSLKLSGGAATLTELQRQQLVTACRAYYLWDRPVEELSQTELDQQQNLRSAVAKMEAVV